MGQDPQKPVDESIQTESVSMDAILDELSDRIQSGEDVNIEDYCRQHPDYATRIRELEPTLRAMHAFAVSPHDALGSEFECPHKTLGDFRILREIGRGGMGVVYEAEQDSLGRRVALKVLPFASVLDQRQLQRFRNEAQAAAMLKHPGIVTVYSVGLDRGVHYYAMELIEGQSLAEVIAELSDSEEEPIPASDDESESPGAWQSATEVETTPRANLSTEQDPQSRDYYRNVAKLTRAIAEALDYAHGQGVVHRDIKPSNLLLDGLGKVSVADFGLAQFQSEQNLTLTGDLLGTLRYMSPEQADGRKLLDHRTDIYSLGLVLYELLTLQCAFGASDRGQLLRQIIEADPTSPRKLRASIPADLETITLKAIDKEPESRYLSAQDLADDLERFLDHQPIEARRTSEWERARRWVRRNPLVASLAAAVTTLLIVLALVASLFAHKQASLAKRAMKSYDDAIESGYAMSVHSAYRSWHDGDLQRAEAILKPYMKESTSNGDRRFELLHLWNRLKISQQTPFTLRASSREPMAISQDGLHLATIKGDDTIQIWEIQPGRMAKSASLGIDEEITVITFSPSSTTIALGTQSGSVYLISGNDLEVVDLLFRDQYRVVSVAFSPDESLLASSDDEGVVRLFQLTGDRSAAEGRVVDRFEPRHTWPSVTFSPTGTTLVTSGGWAQALARVWSLPDLQPIESLTVSPKLHHVVPTAFTSNGDMMATGGKTIKLWKTSDWSMVERFEIGSRRVTSTCFSPDDRVLAAADEGLIRLFDVEGRRELEPIRGHRSHISSLRFSKTDESLVSVDKNGLVKTWPKSIWAAEASSDASSGWFTGLCFAGRDFDRTLFVSCGQHSTLAREQGRLSLLNLEHDEWQGIREDEYTYTAVASSPTDPNLVAVATQQADNSWAIILWDVRQSQPVGALTGHEHLIYSLAFSPDGTRLAAADLPIQKNVLSKLIVWDVASRSARHTVSSPRIGGLTFSPDGRSLATAGGRWGKGRIRFLDIVSGQWQALEFPCEASGLCVAYIRDGDFIVSGETDGTLAVWDIPRRRRLVASGKKGGIVTCLAVSPNQLTIAVGLGDSTVTLWDSATLSQLATLRVPATPTSARFSGDGATLAVGCTDGTVVVWDVDGSRKTFANEPASASLSFNGKPKATATVLRQFKNSPSAYR